MKIKRIGIVLSLLLLASCNNSKKTSETENIGETTNNSDETVVTPQEKDDYYVVNFDTLGHGEMPNQETVLKGDLQYASIPTEPKANGYKFRGWYKDKELTEKFDFSEALNGNITLYAKWKEYTGVPYDTTKTPTIFLAGDSTVQTYSDAQYIGGWGQYFDSFFDDKVNIVNCARGGRSSRSFINEGRLFDNSTYSFTENGGKSIEETIKEGDYLFVQFGHNDDDTKLYPEDTGYQYERMVPLGNPDSNGIYPVTIPTTKASTSLNLPADMTDKTKAEILKYGSEYFEYGNGTYKGYLKMYIDFARSKGATPVLVTPVARVSFSNGKIVGGPGKHGDDFAYVKAVRQLAEEEKCLLIDNFNFSKNILETATSTFSDFLMAIVPNSINNGPWPSGYDNAYKNSDAGFKQMEGTHYNKYGAYLTAAYVADAIIEADAKGIVSGKDNKEYFNFVSHILEEPKKYVNPSNRISISKVKEIESVFENVCPTDPNREYVKADVAIKAINELKNKGSLDSITKDNYETWLEYCSEARSVYESLNFDIRNDVTNYDLLLEYEAKAKSARPKAIKTIVLSANDFINNTTPITVDDHKFSFDAEINEYNKTAVAFEFNDINYTATAKSIRLNGNSSGNVKRYVEFNVTGKCEITCVASGGGETSRYIQLTNGSKTIGTFEVEPSQTKNTVVVEEAGTYRIGSTGSNIDLYYIIIEYYA